MNVAYTYDGTLEGLMTAIYTAYASRCEPMDICQSHNVQMRLDQEIVDIRTDMDAALRVRTGICRQLGIRVWSTIAQASTCDDPATGTKVYRFVRYALDSTYACKCTGCPGKSTCNSPCKAKTSKVLDECSHPSVEPLLRLQRHASCEAERMRQFIRFEHTSDDFWFAKCNPNASVVPLVMSHFASRFNTQRFVIYDEAHHLAGMSSQGRWQLVRTDDITVPERAEEEGCMQDAWKRFYRALSVESRYNPELRRQFMPKRLWDNITELRNDP